MCIRDSTGELGSWNPIGDFGYRGDPTMPATQTMVESFSVPVGALPAGGSAYVLWLDDNSATNPDALYTIDNVRFTGVPEPASCLLAWSAAGILGWTRHRKAR